MRIENCSRPERIVVNYKGRDIPLFYSSYSPNKQDSYTTPEIRASSKSGRYYHESSDEVYGITERKAQIRLIEDSLRKKPNLSLVRIVGIQQTTTYKEDLRFMKWKISLTGRAIFSRE